MSTNKKYFCLIGLIFSSALFIIGVKNINNDICKDSRAPLFLVITGAIILGKMMFNSLTLKDMGFLVSQIHGGGLIQSILEKHSVTPPNFILEQQTESHMKAEVFS